MVLKRGGRGEVPAGMYGQGCADDVRGAEGQIHKCFANNLINIQYAWNDYICDTVEGILKCKCLKQTQEFGWFKHCYMSKLLMQRNYV